MDFEVLKLCVEIVSIFVWMVVEGGIYGDSLELNWGWDGRIDDGVLIVVFFFILGVLGGVYVK